MNKMNLENRLSFNRNSNDQFIIQNNDIISENDSDQHLLNNDIDSNAKNKFNSNLQNRNIETIQCKLRLQDKLIQSDIYPYDSANDIASRILAMYPEITTEYKINLNTLAIKIYKQQNEVSKGNFDSKSLISNKFLEKRMIDIKK